MNTSSLKTPPIPASNQFAHPADWNATGHVDYDRLMVERFFPSYIHRVGQVINLVHQANPATGKKLTMKALSIALRRKLKANDLAFYQQGKKQVHTFRKHRFYSYTYGRGPSVLLLHGWCSHGARWTNYVPELVAAGFQAVVMDAPSHGQSPGRFLSVPDYIACTGVLMHTRVHWHAVLAHSMGSLAGVIAANEYARRAAPGKFVLMSTFRNCDTLMSKFARCLGVSERVLCDTRAWIPEYTGRPLSYFSLVDHLRQMGHPPTMLVADTTDIVVPRQEAKVIVDALPHIQPLFTQGLGHNLRCEQVRDQVIHFIKE